MFWLAQQDAHHLSICSTLTWLQDGCDAQRREGKVQVPGHLADCVEWCGAAVFLFVQGAEAGLYRRKFVHREPMTERDDADDVTQLPYGEQVRPASSISTASGLASAQAWRGQLPHHLVHEALPRYSLARARERGLCRAPPKRRTLKT